MSFTVIGLWLYCLAPLISAIHIGGGNRSIQRKPQNLSQVTEKLNHIMLYNLMFISLQEYTENYCCDTK
jgi:cytochrome b561